MQPFHHVSPVFSLLRGLLSCSEFLTPVVREKRNRSLSPIATSSLTGFLPTLVFFLFQPLYADAAQEEKFHLVYLVSTNKAEISAPAFVEPLFFTDGRKLIFAYDYCRQYYNRTHNELKPTFRYKGSEVLAAELIGDDLRPIHRYCANQALTIDVSQYSVRSPLGTRLYLEELSFESYPNSPYIYPPIMPDRGITKIRNVEGLNPEMPNVVLGREQQYYFLMSSNRVLLDRIAPLPKVSDSERSRLNERWEQYRKDRMAGRVTSPPAEQCLNYSPKTKAEADFMREYAGYPADKEPQSLFKSIDDVDSDGKADLLVSMLETISVKKKYASTLQRTALRVFYGNGQEACILHTGIGSPSTLQFVAHIGSCTYVGVSLDDSNRSLDLLALQGRSVECGSRSVRKYLEMLN